MNTHSNVGKNYRALIALACLLWAGGLSLLYYRQLWRLPTLEPAAWVKENLSLQVDPALWRALFSGPTSWSMPAFHEAFQRAFSGLWGAILNLSAALVLGGSILSGLRWNSEDGIETILFRITTGLGALAYLLGGIAALGLYRPITIRLLLAVILSAGVIYSLVVKIRRASPREFVRLGFSQGKELLLKLKGTAGVLTGNFPWSPIILAALLIALVGALAPEIEYDALWYHLWLPKIWLQQGKLVDILEEYISLYPFTWELIFGAGMVFGGAVAAKLLHFICLPLVALWIARYARRYFPSVSPWVAVSLWVTIPTVLWEATTAYIDLALTLHVLAAIYALLRYHDGKQGSWLMLAGINTGLALATKHLAMFFFLLLPVGLAYFLWRETHDIRRSLIPAICLGILALCIPLPWYLRSWWASGNPFFPELFKIFGAYPPVRWDAITERGLDHFKASFGRPRTLINLLSLPWDMALHPVRYQGTLGPLFLLLLPGLVLGRGWTLHLRISLGLALAYLAFWASPLSSFQMRFLVPITPFLGFLAAEGFTRLKAVLNELGWRAVQRLFQGSMVLLLLLNLPPFTSFHEADRVEWEGWLTHVVHWVPIGVVVGLESQDTYLERNVPSYAAWRYINAHLPRDVRILTFSGGDHYYSERTRLWSDSTIARPAVWGAARGEEQQAIQALQQLNITHLLFDMRYLEAFPADTLAIAQPEMIEEHYILEYNDSRFRLYRIRVP